MEYPHIQLLQYQLGIWKTNLKQKKGLQVIIPIIIYHGKKKWQVKRFAEYFPAVEPELSRFIPEFQYLFQDLSHLSDEDIKERVFKRAATAIAALMMKHIYDFGDAKKVKKQKAILLELIEKIIHIGLLYYEEEEGLRFFQGVIQYLFKRSELPKEEVIKTIKSISIKGGEQAMTIAAQLINEGMKQGIEKGKRQGIEQGIIQEKQIVLIRQLNKKFGTSEQEEAFIRNYYNLDALDQALDKILFAEKKEEVWSCLI